MSHSPHPFEHAIQHGQDAYEREVDVDVEAAEVQPLVPNSSHDKLTVHSFFNTWFQRPNIPTPDDRLTSMLSIPSTPMSSDGVFANIPAKPSSSRDPKSDDELDEDEWIFMTPEQRKKMAPPKYSRIKRDRAPLYTTEYTPPQLPPCYNHHMRKRAPSLNPRVNLVPVGSRTSFLATTFLCTICPFIGYLLAYVANGRRWKTHAYRLGAQTGMGLGLLHVGAMIIYIPIMLPSVLAAYVWLVASLIWTILIGIPFGWRLSKNAITEFMWVQAQERALRRTLGVSEAPTAAMQGDVDEDLDGGYNYIEGTDIRARDLRKIIAKARLARLARSLRAAGF